MTPDGLPPPDDPDAPWFVYRSGPGWVQGRPYSRSGLIAFLALLALPFAAVVIGFLTLRDRPVVLAMVTAASMLLCLGSTFTLMFKLGQRIP